jgi:WS/DGAT/MGAT family acyltransferase
MQRLGPLDAIFVEAENEDRHISMAIASIAVIEGPMPSYDEFVAAIESRLPLVPRYRQRMREVPFRLGPPVWVDSPGFDIRRHIKQTALPVPGGDAELFGAMAQIMGSRLDRDHPLWEYWMVGGLADGRWALVSKVHHCMVDGVSGTDLYRVMFDTGEVIGAGDPAPSTATSRTDLIADAARAAFELPRDDAAVLAGIARHPVRTWRRVADLVGGGRKLLGALPVASKSSLTGPIGGARRYTVARTRLGDVRTVRRALGGTFNDVILAAVTSGFRDLLLARGETPDRRMVPSLVPVSLRAPGEEGIYENRVSGMVVHLPVDLERPDQQLQAIRDELLELKSSKESTVGAAWTSLAGFVPYPLASLSRFAFRLPQREIVTVTTDVPGPRDTLYCLGRPVLEILPYVPIATTVRIGVAIFSYAGDVALGVTGDYDSAPDIDILAKGFERAMSDLVEGARIGAEATA